MGSTRAVPGQTISNHTACDCDLTMDANPTSDDDDDGDDGDCDSGCRKAPRPETLSGPPGVWFFGGVAGLGCLLLSFGVFGVPAKPWFQAATSCTVDGSRPRGRCSAVFCSYFFYGH